MRKINRAEVYSPNPEHRSRFARKMEKRLGIEIVAREKAKEAVEEKDIVIAATNSSRPVVEGSWISKGAHVTSIVNSDHRFPRRELDNETFARADLVVIASLEQCQQDHAADIFESIEAGVLSWEKIYELGEVVAGKRRRQSAEQITLFKNNALAVEFTALASRVFQLARDAGLGEKIPARYFPAKG